MFFNMHAWVLYDPSWYKFITNFLLITLHHVDDDDDEKYTHEKGANKTIVDKV